MKQLTVPLVLQKSKSKDCGPAAVASMLSYFGKTARLADIIKASHYFDNGTTIYNNGSQLLNADLKTTVITANPLLYAAEDIQRLGSSKTKLTNFIRQKRKAEKDKFNKANLDDMLEYVRLGGEIKLQIPTAADLRQALDKGMLVEALIYGNVLGEKQGRNHFVVVSGYRKNQLFINNPKPESRKQSWENIDQFMYALYSGTTNAFDNGSLMIVGEQ